MPKIRNAKRRKDSLKRVKSLYEKLISDDNLKYAIREVNRTHHWRKGHRPNSCTAWVEETMEERVRELREIINKGFVPAKPRVAKRWDKSSRKYRTVCEPKQWPDQYIHHALIQVIEPVMMRGMDFYCCGSIRGRGQKRAIKALSTWMRKDKKGTKYGLTCDIKHFYDNLNPNMVMNRMRHLIKDKQILDVIWRVVEPGITIGAYTSQWFANTVLQPLDVLIRQHKGCKHYVRYMDNFTILGSNKRELRKLRGEIEGWLVEHGLMLKSDWQIYKISQRNRELRIPDAVGYRFGRGYVIPRKRNLLRIKRTCVKVMKRKAVGFRLASGTLSLIAMLKHCNNHNLYRLVFKGEKIVKKLKAIVSKYSKKGLLLWSTYLEQREKMKLSGLKMIPQQI